MSLAWILRIGTFCYHHRQEINMVYKSYASMTTESVLKHWNFFLSISLKQTKITLSAVSEICVNPYNITAKFLLKFNQ